MDPSIESKYLNFHFQLKMSEHNIYGYNPSLPAAIIFIILFGVSTVYHGYQLVKSRCMYFIPFLIGGVCKFIRSLAIYGYS